MQLIIAEKPSLGRAIAEVLPKPHVKRAGYIDCGDGQFLVAPCAGHILEQAEPHEYDPAFKQWRLDHLPIVPRDWKLAVTAPDLLKTIQGLLPKAERVIHAGDPDREGQLLVQEVLVYLGYRGPVDRLLVSDLNPPAVRKALADLQPNARFESLYQAALARQRADWLYGLNMTRCYTLLARTGGYDGVISIGRVQTPLLGLVVRRDLEIENFVPQPFLVVAATIGSAKGSFRATWRPSERDAGALDAEGRLVSNERAAAIVRATSGQAGAVTTATIDRKSEAPPLPYSLADIQVDASKRLGLSAKEVLEVCQALYEKHRLTTYPRSDCSYLPEGHLEQAAAVLAAIGRTAPALSGPASQADLSRRSRAWNDSKVTAHHAIIPTTTITATGALSENEGAIYDLIARRYLMQFSPAFEYNQAELEVTVEGERFSASGRQPLVPGWRALLPQTRGGHSDEEKAEDAPAADTLLPALTRGESVTALEVAAIEKQTRPPKRFTDDTLLQAMTGISRFVADPKIKAMLRETDGIGTPATQAQIIQTLFDRQYVEKKGRQIISTSTARALIQTLPPVATTPDMTALWEMAMRMIQDGERTLDAFLAATTRQLEQLLAGGKSLGALRLPGSHPCPSPGCTGFLGLRKTASGAFRGCSRYPDCKFTQDITSARKGGGTKRRAGRAGRSPRQSAT
jgi:DNA topoisomerase-3